MYRVYEVKTRKQRRDFISLPFKLYKNNPFFVPMLRIDERAIFKKDYYYNKVSESIFYVVYKDNKCVGRIQGIYHFVSNEKWNQKRVRFTRFDSIDDQEVAHLLISKIKEYAKSKECNELVGPLGYSDMEREGLLIEGFSEYQTFEEQYNYSYYAHLLENEGFEKEVDWVEHQIYKMKDIDPKVIKLVDLIKKREGFEVLEFKNINHLIKTYASKVFDMIDETYGKLYGTVPFFSELRSEIIKTFKLILTPSYIRIIVDKDGDIASFGIAFPSISELLKSLRVE